jgi:hypothetical protein
MRWSRVRAPPDPPSFKAQRSVRFQPELLQDRVERPSRFIAILKSNSDGNGSNVRRIFWGSDANANEPAALIRGAQSSESSGLERSVRMDLIAFKSASSACSQHLCASGFQGDVKVPSKSLCFGKFDRSFALTIFRLLSIIER